METCYFVQNRRIYCLFGKHKHHKNTNICILLVYKQITVCGLVSWYVLKKLFLTYHKNVVHKLQPCLSWRSQLWITLVPRSSSWQSLPTGFSKTVIPHTSSPVLISVWLEPTLRMQYLPNRDHSRWEIKLWMLWDAVLHYCLAFFMNHGAKSIKTKLKFRSVV